MAAQVLGIGQVRIQLGISGRDAGLGAGQAVLAQRPQQRGAAAPRALPVIDIDAEAACRLQRQIAGIFQPAAGGVGKQPARPAGAALVVADLRFGATDRRIALAEDALVELIARIAGVVELASGDVAIDEVPDPVVEEIGFPAQQAFGLLQAQFQVARGFLPEGRIADVIGAGRLVRPAGIQFLGGRRALRQRAGQAQAVARLECPQPAQRP